MVGAVAVKFSTRRAEELADRIRFWALTLAAASLVLMGVLMSVAIHFVVDRPIRRFMDAISPAATDGVPATVSVATADEFGVLARHFNEMVARIGQFSDELRTRIAEATGELDRRYQQVEQLNALLFEMQRRLSHAERLALSGQVMAEVAHEVGTPLHSVAGHLELLRKDLPPAVLTGDVERRLTVIETQVARVIEIIGRLLDATRRSPGEPTTVDLDGLARDTAELVRPGLASGKIDLEVRSEPALPLVRGRRDQLQQVILNLLMNAIDATLAGGRVELLTRARPDHGEVEVAVGDTGPGISAADRKHIFEPFFSTKEAGQRHRARAVHHGRDRAGAQGPDRARDRSRDAAARSASFSPPCGRERERSLLDAPGGGRRSGRARAAGRGARPRGLPGTPRRGRRRMPAPGRSRAVRPGARRPPHARPRRARRPQAAGHHPARPPGRHSHRVCHDRDGDRSRQPPARPTTSPSRSDWKRSGSWSGAPSTRGG